MCSCVDHRPGAVGEDGGILADALTDASVGDASALPGLLGKVPNRVKRLTADGGYDRCEVYEAARQRGASTVIPPRIDAVVSGVPVFSDRAPHIERIGEVERRRWRLEAGQHHQSRAENTFYRYKKRFGGRLSARNEEAQRNEMHQRLNREKSPAPRRSGSRAGGWGLHRRGSAPGCAARICWCARSHRPAE